MYVNRKTKNKERVSDLKWQDDSGNYKIAETDNETASTLAEFFFQCILWKTTSRLTLKVYLIDLSATIRKCQILL